MTNKLPEVGKRYKNKAWNKESEIKEIYSMVKIGEFEPIRLDEFWEYFEELPDSQEKPEVQLTESIWKPVNELPEDEKLSVVVELESGEKCFSTYIKQKGFCEVDGSRIGNFYGRHNQSGFSPKEIKYCTLTDFINDIEQAKLDHEERLRKLEGNDI